MTALTHGAPTERRRLKEVIDLMLWDLLPGATERRSYRNELTRGTIHSDSTEYKREGLFLLQATEHDNQDSHRAKNLSHIVCIGCFEKVESNLDLEMIAKFPFRE